MLSTKILYPGGDAWELPDGRFHREDGPAIVYITGEMEFYLCDSRVPLSFNDYCSVLKRNYGKTDEDIMMIRMQYDIN